MEGEQSSDMGESVDDIADVQHAISVSVILDNPSLDVTNLGDDLTGVVVVGDVVPELLSLRLIELSVLVGIVVVKNPLAVLPKLPLLRRYVDIVVNDRGSVLSGVGGIGGVGVVIVVFRRISRSDRSGGRS
jgi:hypothetical protein